MERPNKIKGYSSFIGEASNYPPGAANDPNAPYNQVDPDREIEGRGGKQPNSGIDFEVEGHNGEFCILKSKGKGKLYSFYLEAGNDPDLPAGEKIDDYKAYYREADGYDEDGSPDYEYHYDDDLDEEGIENWLWNHLDSTDIGKGLEDWEDGEKVICEIDQELAQELYGDFAKYSSTKWRSKSKHFRGSLRHSEKLAYKDMMDTIKKEFPDVESEWAE